MPSVYNLEEACQYDGRKSKRLVHSEITEWQKKWEK